MSSSLFQRFGQRQREQQNRLDAMIAGVREFQRVFSGNPEERLQALVSSGKVPQDILNRAQEQALPIYNAMKSLAGR